MKSIFELRPSLPKYNEIRETLHLINLSDISFVGKKMIIHLNHLLKQSKPGKHPGPLVLESYEIHRSLCIAKVSKEYID